MKRVLLLVTMAAIAVGAECTAATPILIAQAAAPEIDLWRSVESAGDPRELEIYLKAYPNGQFAPLARLRIERLRGPKEQRAAPAETKAIAPAAATSGASAVADVPPAPRYKHRGWIGVVTRQITEARARELGLVAASGVEVLRVFDGSPAAKGGLRPRDAILSVDGDAVRDDTHFAQLSAGAVPGRAAELAILRDGQRAAVKIEVGDRFAVVWAGAHRGNADFMFYLGTIFQAGSLVPQDYREAHRWFLRAAEAGNRSAMHALGDEYQFGKGVARDDREASRWYERAADRGNGVPESMARLGIFYDRGQGVLRDRAQAAHWYRLAADKGHAGATHNYGLLLAAGEGVAKNEALAFEYFRKAAVLGLPNAMYALGRAYEKGRSVVLDPREAARWYRQAAERGHGQAHGRIGEFYERGEGGLPKSRVDAIRHYRKAAELGQPQIAAAAVERLKALNASVHDPQEVQQLLSDLGYDPGPIDGQPGAKTTQAIREFQRRRGLTVDGQASLALIGQLRNALKEKSAAAQSAPNLAAPSADAGPAALKKLDALKVNKLD